MSTPQSSTTRRVRSCVVCACPPQPIWLGPDPTDAPFRRDLPDRSAAECFFAVDSTRFGDGLGASDAIPNAVVIYQSNSVLCGCDERTRKSVESYRKEPARIPGIGSSNGGLGCPPAIDHIRPRSPRFEYEPSADSTGGRGPRPNSSTLGAAARFAKSVASMRTRVESTSHPLALERSAADPYVDRNRLYLPSAVRADTDTAGRITAPTADSTVFGAEFPTPYEIDAATTEPADTCIIESNSAVTSAAVRKPSSAIDPVHRSRIDQPCAHVRNPCSKQPTSSNSGKSSRSVTPQENSSTHDRVTPRDPPV